VTLCIAMWSGPRNISTAMMRSWENRPDTVVVDEPLYAHFLAETGIAHPGRDEVIAAGETDWRRAVAGLLAPVESAIFYQKQMTHHLLPHIDRGWMAEVRNCFLIRDPREVLLSYAKKRADVTVDDVGILQQAEIFDYVRDLTGDVPPVLDTRDVLTDPRKALGALCQRLSIEFREEMLAWPPGRRDSDGIWAPYWYDAVWKSTGFRPWQSREGELTESQQAILEECQPHYERLRKHCLRG
jgi:hypothetical protein